MAKAVKNVGRAVGKVVSGIGKAVSKVAKSKFGKVLLTAATVYFGGAAIMGAVGGASAGSGIMGTITGAIKGGVAGLGSATQGIASAWSGITSGNLSAAGSSLMKGVTGASSAGTTAAGGTVGQAFGTGMNATKGLLQPPGAAASTAAAPPGTVAPGPTAPGPMTPGTLPAGVTPEAMTAEQVMGMPTEQIRELYNSGKLSGNVASEVAQKLGPDALKQSSTGFFKNPYVQYGLLQTAAGAVAGHANQKQAESDERRLLGRRNRNMGDPVFQSEWVRS